MKIYQLRYKVPKSAYGPQPGFILTVPSQNSDHPISPEIKNALETAGFKNVNLDWCQLRCWE